MLGVVASHMVVSSGPPGQLTWDFRGLSALPAGWSKRGTFTETFDSAGVEATFDQGESIYYTLAANAPNGGTLETKMVSGPISGSNMSGAHIFGPSALGGAIQWYTGPSGALLTRLDPPRVYSGGFSSAGGTPAYPAWFRVRFSTTPGNAIFGSYSLDGSSWSSEASLSQGMGGVNEIALGSIFGTAAAKFEYATWTPV